MNGSFSDSLSWGGDEHNAIVETGESRSQDDRANRLQRSLASRIVALRNSDFTGGGSCWPE